METSSREIALVPVERVRHLLERPIVLGEVGVEVVERLLVRLGAPVLRVGDEDDAVRAREHELPGRRVVDLAGHGEELEAHRHAADARDADGQEVEVERAVGRRRERHHLPAMLRFRGRVDVLERGGFTPKPRPVEHELEDELPRMRVHRRHLGPSIPAFAGRARQVYRLSSCGASSTFIATGLRVSTTGRRRQKPASPCSAA